VLRTIGQAKAHTVCGQGPEVLLAAVDLDSDYDSERLRGTRLYIELLLDPWIERVNPQFEFRLNRAVFGSVSQQSHSWSAGELARGRRAQAGHGDRLE
jgi:hypothetical protein